MPTFISNYHPPKTVNHPPEARGHWLMGLISMIHKDPLSAFDYLFKNYGDAVRFKAFAHYWGYMFAHPDHNKHILQDNNRNYTKMPSPAMDVLRPLVGNGLLTSDGEFWRRQRRLAQPAFHRRRLVGFAETMTAATTAMLARWQGRPAVDLDEEMMQLTLEIVGRTLFSIDITGEAEAIGEAFSYVNEKISALSTLPFGNIVARFPILPTIDTLHDNIAVLDDVVHKIISERRQVLPDQRPNDLLTMLMEAIDEETGEGMDDQQLRDEVMTILLAGHETTSNALTWTFYLLHENPAVRQKLDEELANALNGRLPTFADLPNLTYTKMVIEESMRLYPPAYALSRYCQETDKVGGYDVPAGAIITLIPYLTHRHPDFWDDPTRFDPERFTPERSADRPRYAYLPFSGGPRQCIGNNFAMTEAILLLATIAQRYHLTLEPGHRVETEPLITLRPAGGMPMRLTAVNRPVPAL